jgi:hypothetical protein
MPTRNVAAILFLVPLLFGASAAYANAVLLQTLSNQELANITGASVVIAVREIAENNQADRTGIGGDEFRNFLGIQTVSTNIGVHAISQAETSLTVRARLSGDLHLTGSAGF